MPYSRTYIPGDRLYDCERCGFTYRVSQLKREQTLGSKNLIVCERCFDGPHPRDKPVRNRPEGKLVRIR